MKNNEINENPNLKQNGVSGGCDCYIGWNMNNTYLFISIKEGWNKNKPLICKKVYKDSGIYTLY
jgi:hypothetical protein